MKCTCADRLYSGWPTNKCRGCKVNFLIDCKDRKDYSMATRFFLDMERPLVSKKKYLEIMER